MKRIVFCLLPARQPSPHGSRTRESMSFGYSQHGGWYGGPLFCLLFGCVVLGLMWIVAKPTFGAGPPLSAGGSAP
jgi:hypothetical protein